MSVEFSGTPIKADLPRCPCGGEPTYRRIAHDFPVCGSEYVRCKRCSRITDIYPEGGGEALSEWREMVAR